MDQRRLLLALTISLLIIVLYQELIVRRFYPPSESVPSPSAMAPSPSAPDVAAAPAADPAAIEPAPAPVAAAAEARDLVIETERVRATFTTLGARLRSFELRDYRATVAPDSPLLQMVQFPGDGGLPLGVGLLGEHVAALDDGGVVYAVEEGTAADGSRPLTFTGQLPGGATITKRITIPPQDYLWSVDVAVDRVPSGYTQLSLAWNEGIDPAGADAAEIVFDQVLVLQRNKTQSFLFTSFEGTAPVDLAGDIDWLAFSGRYFLAAMIPQAEPTNSLRAWARRSADQVQSRLIFPAGVFRTHADLYVGPKNIDRLEAVGHGLRKAVDLGWFTVVALPLLQALDFLHGFTGNYGVAIILLTVLIKVLFYPLTKKSFQSMRDMQKLQPEMQRLRERYKDKPEEMNRAIMELYREHKVNPLGGCLPMLLQLPVFVGLYNALLNAVELRHAPFIGWITDLSAPDRLGSLQLPFVQHPGIPVLTIIMGASMLVQQWMTPSPADPTQQRVMMIMPVMFTFMFINFPSGLVLYWLVNNILTIAQQYAMMRQPAAAGR